jgi:hypothetical protein
MRPAAAAVGTAVAAAPAAARYARLIRIQIELSKLLKGIFIYLNSVM